MTKLKKILTDENITVQKIADAINVTVQTVYKYYSNSDRHMKSTTCKKYTDTINKIKGTSYTWMDLYEEEL